MVVGVSGWFWCRSRDVVVLDWFSGVLGWSWMVLGNSGVVLGYSGGSGVHLGGSCRVLGCA